MTLKSIKVIAFLSIITFGINSINGQSFLKKKEIKAYKCGYVHKESFFSKIKPMKLISKAVGGLVKAGKKSDLEKTAAMFIYTSNIIPKSKLDFATKTPGWETCGDGIAAVFLNYEGVGLTDTDGDVLLNGTKIEKAGMGTYFQGFSPDKRGSQEIEVTSSSGDKINVTMQPAEPLEIISVNGIEKGGDIIIDGTKDLVIELKNGDADLDSKLYVEVITSAMSLKVQTHLFPSKAKNRIVVPIEAFKNYENSPLPIIKKNTLIVTRVKHDIVRNTDAGIIQKLSMYSDFTPILIKGDIAGGNLLKNSFSKDKNTNVSDGFKTVEGEYNVKITKGNPFSHPPVKMMKNVGIASFVIRGNLKKEKTTVSSSSTTNFNIKTTTTTTTTIKKWFPKLEDNAWQKLADKLYTKFANSLKNNNGINVIPVETVVKAKAYAEMKPILDTVTATFVEKGAGGTRRLLSTNFKDFWKDLKTTFPADYINEKLIQELNLDGLIAVTIDLDFDLESEGLNPKVKIMAFAPNVSFKTPAKYFEMDFSTDAKSLKSVNTYNALTGGPEDVVLKVIKGDELLNAFKLAMEELKKGEEKNPAYNRIWEERMK
ncbi:hypothetical protein OD91_1427 [Lutibacter sp. Hel_I_33_5]|uniref:hypothetical protein n=1 Tax=Lutibacter sp. Hel_I_33_5 TaxID=1566289 RepID=UPI00119FA870|nr:hypothetical protein [Lutibacter sp. Hel_I_33_5]TVZ56147.1 hypothetical protein OD91_1427 [Lutibacter sp. Hel_I_33_5]